MEDQTSCTSVSKPALRDAPAAQRNANPSHQVLGNRDTNDDNYLPLVLPDQPHQNGRTCQEDDVGEKDRQSEHVILNGFVRCVNWFFVMVIHETRRTRRWARPLSVMYLIYFLVHQKVSGVCFHCHCVPLFLFTYHVWFLSLLQISTFLPREDKNINEEKASAFKEVAGMNDRGNKTPVAAAKMPLLFGLISDVSGCDGLRSPHPRHILHLEYPRLRSPDSNLVKSSSMIYRYSHSPSVYEGGTTPQSLHREIRRDFIHLKACVCREFLVKPQSYNK